MPKLVLLSDTHSRHPDVPAGDVLIHAGDFSNLGSPEELEAFDAWLAAQPHRHKLLIAGNHDFALERDKRRALGILRHATYLEDEELEVDGLRIYGSPWTPWFLNWAFMLPRGAELAERWARIPPGLDVLVTHGPPQGILDLTAGGEHAGCEELLARVREVRPRLHVFGHIHEAAGRHQEGETLFLNVACGYSGRNPPVVVEL